MSAPLSDLRLQDCLAHMEKHPEVFIEAIKDSRKSENHFVLVTDLLNRLDKENSPFVLAALQIEQYLQDKLVQNESDYNYRINLISRMPSQNIDPINSEKTWANYHPISVALIAAQALSKKNKKAEAECDQEFSNLLKIRSS
jgi:hypothetical protein